MGTILPFRIPDKAGQGRTSTPGEPAGEVVIFPGIRIERHDLDLGHRLRDCAGRGEFDGINNGRPRKTS